MKRNIQNIEDDIIRKKRLIEQILCTDEDIIEILDNKKLKDALPEEYIGENIFGFLRVPGTQDVSKNFITFVIDDMGRAPNNPTMKSQYIQFVVFVHKDLVDTKYGMARHDLLGYLIRDIFHLSNMLGSQLEIIYNKEGITDTDFYTRTLKFEMTTPNSMQPYKTNKYERGSIVYNHDRKVQHESV